MEKVFSSFTLYREPASPVGTRCEALLHGLANGDILVLYFVAGCDTGVVVVVSRRRYIGEVKIEENAAHVRPKRQDQVRVHDTFVDIDHEIGVDPEVPGAIALARGGNLRILIRRNHGAGLKAITPAILNGVVGVVEHAVEPLVQMGNVVSAIEIVIDINFPVAIEGVVFARVKVERVEM